MARNLPTGYEEAFSQPNTDPVYLLSLALQQRTYYWCTAGQTVPLLGQNWVAQALSIRGPTQKAGSTAHLDFTVPFEPAGPLITDIIAVRPQDRQVGLYVTYVHNGGYLSPYKIFSGLTSNVTTTPGRGRKVGMAQFSAVNTGNRQSSTPFVRIRPPTFRHLTPKGSVVSWNGLKLEIH